MHHLGARHLVSVLLPFIATACLRCLTLTYEHSRHWLLAIITRP